MKSSSKLPQPIRSQRVAGVPRLSSLGGNGHSRCLSDSMLVTTVAMFAPLLSCSSSNGKAYGISPIFPLSEDKCATYGGEEEGDGFGATCMVTQKECQRAAADWRELMESSGINDAIDFSCT